MKDNQFILLTENQVSILDNEQLIQECTVAAVKLDDGNVIAKNICKNRGGKSEERKGKKIAILKYL